MLLIILLFIFLMSVLDQKLRTTLLVISSANWIKRVHIFLDNTSSTNKNFFLMGWAHEMVLQKQLDFLRLSFLIAGHTKFSPDLLFSKIAQSYNRSDVFTTEELISTYATVIIELVCDWRSPITKKFSKLPGIRTLHVYSRNASGVVATVRDLCYTGSYVPSTTSHVLRGRVASECVIPDTETQNYTTLGNTHCDQ